MHHIRLVAMKRIEEELHAIRVIRWNEEPKEKQRKQASSQVWHGLFFTDNKMLKGQVFKGMVIIL